MIGGIKRSEYGGIFNPDNMWTATEERGAGNNWASGHSQGESKCEEIFDMINREADNSDSLEVKKLRAQLIL
ncbi:hypothetical protein M1146_05545 [Patescibacteria group bacterium]|nr:hypothetical protein [Patescibacteria group bacterium]